METDKMNESQEKDSAEAMDTQEDKKEEGDAPQGIIWSFTNQIIIIWPSVTSNVGDDNESLPTLLNIGENNIAVIVIRLSNSRKPVNIFEISIVLLFWKLLVP